MHLLALIVPGLVALVTAQDAAVTLVNLTDTYDSAPSTYDFKNIPTTELNDVSQPASMSALSYTGFRYLKLADVIGGPVLKPTSGEYSILYGKDEDSDHGWKGRNNSVPWFSPRSVRYACMHDEGPGPPWKQRPTACKIRFTAYPFTPAASKMVKTSKRITTSASSSKPQTFKLEYKTEDVKAERWATATFPIWSGLGSGNLSAEGEGRFVNMSVVADPDGDSRGTFLVGLDDFAYTVAIRGT